MASSSSYCIMASSMANNATVYDVFLSFRGKDTRNAFTDHLYEALERAGLRTFRDNDEINRGEFLMPEIKAAIMESRASIVVFSENYATSTWCLEELSWILEQRRESDHFVLPIFYHIDPSHIRKQNEILEMVVKTSSKLIYQNLIKWQVALLEAVNLAGLVLSAGLETEFLKGIVNIIYDKLNPKEVHVPVNLVGMNRRYQEISSWFEKPREFLVIYGMGGSGKTTFAKYIYNSNRKLFGSMSFVEDIGTKCKCSHGLLGLQNQLLEDILGGKNRKLPSVSQGTCTIGEALYKKKALIVLDDIDEESQLVALIGTRMINARSKIIITTRKYCPKKWFENRRCINYSMKLLNKDDSSELLSRHAFGSKIPIEGFEELIVKAIHYCEGNPLALEVLGSSLSEGNTISYWESQLKLLERDTHSRILSVLIRSYDSLPYLYHKELFLHIACFFIGQDVDYVTKILEHDYFATSGIQALTNRCLLSVSPNKKLTMHRMIRDMGRHIVRQESFGEPAKRTRVWLNLDSYEILSKGKGSKTIQGLSLDMRSFAAGKYISKFVLPTNSLQNMDRLKLLQLRFVQLRGSYKNFSKDLRWLSWSGFDLRTIPYDLVMRNVVAIDMSFSKLEEFRPPQYLFSLKILNLKDSHDLSRIDSFRRMPSLETLILWNCRSLDYVCYDIESLERLALLNMTGCEKACRRVQGDPYIRERDNFYLPSSLQRLFLNDCYTECAESCSLRFYNQLHLRYLNLSNSQFLFVPCYDHLKSLRVLDLSFCLRLEWILCLPSTLAELYIYHCVSLKKVTFQSPRFTLQEIGYEGCINLIEIEGFIKLAPIALLDEADLGHLNWLKLYQYCEVCLVDDDGLTVDRRHHGLQMLYEFDIMSTSLPDLEDSNTTLKYLSEFSSLTFEVPLCPKKRKLIGIDVAFKYTLSGKECAWFAKISTANGLDLMYNPKVFGKPAFHQIGLWLSYWPIGNMLAVGDKVNVSIVVINGMNVHQCGASLVYSDDEVVDEPSQNNMEWVEVLGGDLSGFQLSNGAYYLCRRDFFELLEVDIPTPAWFRMLVGDSVDSTEVRGWRKTGRPQQPYQSFTELKTVRCIIHGPGSVEIYNVTEMKKSSTVDKTMASTAPKEKMQPSTSTSRTLTLKDQLDRLPVVSPYPSTVASPMGVQESFDVYLGFHASESSFGLGLDDQLRKKGLRICPYPLYALRPYEVRASIILLSLSYVSSRWCLDELLLVLEKTRNSNHLVLPVFYGLEPPHIRKNGKGLLLETFQGLWKSTRQVDEWHSAITEIANLRGITYSEKGPVMDAVLEEISVTMQHQLSPVPVSK